MISAHLARTVRVGQRDDPLVEQAVEETVADAPVDRPRTTVRLAHLGDRRGLHVHPDAAFLEEATAQFVVERRLFGGDELAGLGGVPGRVVAVGGAARVVDDDLRIDQGADLEVGVETAADAGDHHVVDRNVSGASVEQARRRRPGQRRSHADVDGGHIGTADRACPRCARCRRWWG